MVRKVYTPIPHKMIAEGILLSVANSKRYVNESQSLHLADSNQTALLCLFLAAEELAKANLLFGHFLKGEDVPRDRVEAYFKSHSLKIEEFYRFLYSHALIPKELTPERITQIIKGKGFSEQSFKERIMYADWTDNRWHDPLHNADFAFASIKDTHEWLKARIVDLALSLKGQISNFENSFDFHKVLAAPIVDVPTELRVWEILTEYVPPHTSAVVRVWGSQIKVNIHPNAPLFLKKELKDALMTRWKEYDVRIEISKKGFSRPW